MEKYPATGDGWKNESVAIVSSVELQINFSSLPCDEPLKAFLAERFLADAEETFDAGQLSGILAMRLRDFANQSDLGEEQRKTLSALVPEIVQAILGNDGESSMRRKIAEDAANL